MAFDVAAELKAKIARENDEDRRTVLLLLLGVFEANLAGLEAISKKIDDLISDEQSLRQTVLNGHATNHDKHHEWVELRMNSGCAEACGWAEKKMIEEQDAAKTAAEDAKADKRAARDALIRLVVTAVVSSAASIAGVLWAVR